MSSNYPLLKENTPMDKYLQTPEDGDVFASLLFPSSFDPFSSNSSQKQILLDNVLDKQQKGNSKKRKIDDLEQDQPQKSDKNPPPEREKRLLKNRKAARQFRKRQKEHIADLEKKVENLTSENSNLTSKVQLLSTENKLIREQLNYMRTFVMNALQLSFGDQPQQQSSGTPRNHYPSRSAPVSNYSPSSLSDFATAEPPHDYRSRNGDYSGMPQGMRGSEFQF